MALSEILGNPPGRKASHLCGVGGILSRLSANDRRAFQSALVSGVMKEKIFEYDWPSQALSKTMTEAGYPVGDQAIRRHRRQDCTCPRP